MTNLTGFNLQDLLIDEGKAFGKTKVVVDQSPLYSYTNGSRNNEPIGTKFTVVLPERKFAKITVKVEGVDPLPDEMIEKTPRVIFTNLTAKIYAIDENVGLTVKADAIKVVQS